MTVKELKEFIFEIVIEELDLLKKQLLFKETSKEKRVCYYFQLN